MHTPLYSITAVYLYSYIACSICSYQCDKYTCLDMNIRAGVPVVEKTFLLLDLAYLTCLS